MALTMHPGENEFILRALDGQRVVVTELALEP
jgi:hypothetical protein